MFDDDDPVRARVRELALGFPDADEKVSHGRPACFTKKVFAYYGGALKEDGDWLQHPQSIIVQPEPDERRALVDDPRVYVPAYLSLISTVLSTLITVSSDSPFTLLLPRSSSISRSRHSPS